MDGSKKVVKDPQTLILEGIDEQILLLSRDRRIIWANEKAIGDLGLKREDVIEKHCYEVTHHRNTPCGPPNEVCPIRESLETHAPATKTHTHFSPRGNKSYFEVTVYPVKDKSGEITHFVHITKDISKDVHEERLKEEMWTEIINAMERIYADLANSQTELEKAEEELRRHRNHLEELVEEKNTEA